MRIFLQFVALALLCLGADSKTLRWQDDTPSWAPPQETIAHMGLLELGFSPAPTGAPDPAIVELKLAKRATNDDICGFISGMSTRSLECDVGSCVVDTRLSVVGCCTGRAAGDCNIATDCLPFTSSRLYTRSDSSMRYCSNSARPECITYIYADVNIAQYSIYECASTSAEIMIYASPTDTSIESEVTSTPTAASDAGATSTGTPASGSTSTASAPATDDDSSPPVGAIVGGVVGGVAVIALIALGIFVLLRKKRKGAQDNTTPQQQYQPPQMYQAPPQQQPSPGYPPSTPGSFPSGFTPVDNRQSMLKPQYDVSSGAYDHNSASPPTSPPMVSPSPTNQSGFLQYSQPSDPSSPPAGYPASQQQQQQQGGYYNAPPAQGQTAQPGHHHRQSYASELPAARGDGELRELP